LDLGDYTRRLTVSGTAVDQVEAISAALERDLSQHSAIGGAMLRQFGGLLQLPFFGRIAFWQWNILRCISGRTIMDCAFRAGDYACGRDNRNRRNVSQAATCCRTKRKRLTKAIQPMHVYEIRPRKDKRGIDLISDTLPFGRLWYGEANAVSDAIGCAKFFSRSHDAVIRVYDEAGTVIERHEHAGDFKKWQRDQNVCDYRVSRLS